MSMDLSEKCYHCGAPKGVTCKPECLINGDLIIQLDRILIKLNLKRKNLSLIPLKCSGVHSHGEKSEGRLSDKGQGFFIYTGPP